ncbi:hypothetical protein [Legionella fairfieldensis]|uniref:hypothetical protein n=1 Tax=Legionella fairfieldensis TaxID=45064 RepID=UPI0004916952|nr:hypothetical protein [Legionella fairfieldensis]
MTLTFTEEMQEFFSLLNSPPFLKELDDNTLQTLRIVNRYLYSFFTNRLFNLLSLPQQKKIIQNAFTFNCYLDYALISTWIYKSKCNLIDKMKGLYLIAKKNKIILPIQQDTIEMLVRELTHNGYETRKESLDLLIKLSPFFTPEQIKKLIDDVLILATQNYWYNWRVGKIVRPLVRWIVNRDDWHIEETSFDILSQFSSSLSQSEINTGIILALKELNYPSSLSVQNRALNLLTQIAPDGDSIHKDYILASLLSLLNTLPPWMLDEEPWWISRWKTFTYFEFEPGAKKFLVLTLNALQITYLAILMQVKVSHLMEIMFNTITLACHTFFYYIESAIRDILKAIIAQLTPAEIRATLHNLYATFPFHQNVLYGPTNAKEVIGKLFYDVDFSQIKLAPINKVPVNQFNTYYRDSLFDFVKWLYPSPSNRIQSRNSIEYQDQSNTKFNDKEAKDSLREIILTIKNPDGGYYPSLFKRIEKIGHQISLSQEKYTILMSFIKKEFSGEKKQVKAAVALLRSNPGLNSSDDLNFFYNSAIERIPDYSGFACLSLLVNHLAREQINDVFERMLQEELSNTQLLKSLLPKLTPVQIEQAIMLSFQNLHGSNKHSPYPFLEALIIMAPEITGDQVNEYLDRIIDLYIHRENEKELAEKLLISLILLKKCTFSQLKKTALKDFIPGTFIRHLALWIMLVQDFKHYAGEHSAQYAPVIQQIQSSPVHLRQYSLFNNKKPIEQTSHPVSLRGVEH